MKKLIALLMVLACIFTLVACDKDDKTTTTTTTTAASNAKTLYNNARAALTAAGANYKFNFTSTMAQGGQSMSSTGTVTVDGANFIHYVTEGPEYTKTYTMVDSTYYDLQVYENGESLKYTATLNANEYAEERAGYLDSFTALIPALSDAALGSAALSNGSFTLTLSTADYAEFLTMNFGSMADKITVSNATLVVTFEADGSLKSVQNSFTMSNSDYPDSPISYRVTMEFTAPTAVTAPADADQYQPDPHR